MSGVDILISHSRQDAELASNLADLLKGMLNIEAGRIGCTSASEYKHSADEQVRRQLFDAQVFIAFIPPASSRSPRVFFDLGARWKSSRPLLLVAASQDADLDSIPFYGHEVSSLREPSQVEKLVNDVAILLNAEPVYSKEFPSLAEGLIKAANSRDKKSHGLPDTLCHQDQSLQGIKKILSAFDCQLFLTPFDAGLSLTELGGRIEWMIDLIKRSDEMLGCEERWLIGLTRDMPEALGRLTTYMVASETSPIHGLVLDAARAQLVERINDVSRAIGFHQHLDERLFYIGARSNPGIRYYLLDSRLAEAKQLVSEVRMSEDVLSEYLEKLEELIG